MLSLRFLLWKCFLALWSVRGCRVFGCWSWVAVALLGGLTAQGQVPYQLGRVGADSLPPAFALQRAFADWAQQPDFVRQKGIKPYKRWEWFYQSRAGTDGRLDYAARIWEAWQQIGADRPPASARVEGNSWSPVGPDQMVSSTQSYSGHGMGRLNCVAFHPTDPNRIWVGASQGGIWESADNGQTWTPRNEGLPILRINDIAIDPKNPDVLYASSGDYGYLGIDVLVNNRNTNFGLGVFKSTDGGLSWQPTGLSKVMTDFNETQIRKVVIHPEQTERLLATGVGGVWLSENGGTTWTQTFEMQGEDFLWDIAQNPANPAELICSSGHLAGGSNGRGRAALFRSADFGQSWERLDSGIPERNELQRLELAYAPSDPSVIYAVACDMRGGLYGTFMSRDGGNNWSFTPISAHGSNILGWQPVSIGLAASDGGQGTYDLAIAVDPQNPDRLMVGGVNMWASDNAGQSWEVVTYWQYVWGESVHADHHQAAFHPLTGDFYMCTDGGLFRTSEVVSVPESETFACMGLNGLAIPGCLEFPTKWEHLSRNMAITEFYRIGLSRQRAGRLAGGTQDNGTFLNDAGQWQHIYLGDGMEAMISHTNPDHLFVTNPQGQMTRSRDGGRTYQGTLQTDMWAAGEFGNWVTPYLMQTDDANTLFAGFNNVWRSRDQGDNWQRLSDFPPTNYFRGLPLPTVSLAVAPSDPDVIYVGKQLMSAWGEPSRIWVTENGGISWQNRADGLPVNQASPNYFAVDERDPSTAWVVFGGFAEGQKVYRTTNAGRTWENISQGLPNLPINTIAIDHQSANNLIYIGTDLGVYYTHDGMEGWTRYSDALPNVIINELEIHQASRMLYAATYGRGVWTVPLLDDSTQLSAAPSFQVSLFPSPNNGRFSLAIESEIGGEASFQVVDAIGRRVREGRFTVREGKANEPLELSELPPSVYFIRLQLADQKRVLRFVVR